MNVTAPISPTKDRSIRSNGPDIDMAVHRTGPPVILIWIGLRFHEES